MRPRTSALLAFISFGCAAAGLVLGVMLTLSNANLRGAGQTTEVVIFGLLSVGTYFPLLPLADELEAAPWTRTGGLVWAGILASTGTVTLVFASQSGFGSAGQFGVFVAPLGAIWIAGTSWNASGRRAMWGGIAALGMVAGLVLLAIEVSIGSGNQLPMRLAGYALQAMFPVWLLFVALEFRAEEPAAPDDLTVHL